MNVSTNPIIFIKKFFKNKTVGTYVDIGCHHPFKLNNTYLLYKKGWSGLNIDLMKINIDLFNIWRPRDKNICSAISNKNKISSVYIPNNNIPEATEPRIKYLRPASLAMLLSAISDLESPKAERRLREASKYSDKPCNSKAR